MGTEKKIKKIKAEQGNLILAHQINSALTAIKWPLMMIVNGNFGAVTNEQKDIIGKIIQKNEDLLSLVSSLLSATRIEEGKKYYEHSVAGLDDIVQSAVDFYREEALAKKITMAVTKAGESFPKIILDKEMVSLAVQNILDNAIKYTPEGGTVTVGLDVDKKNITCKVQDSGIGIPKNQQDKICSKFFRASNAINMHAHGSGLGLFITKSIIGACGGKFWFESEENKGSAFYFTLPL